MSEIIDKLSSVLLIYIESQSILLKKLLLRDNTVISPRNDHFELEQIEGLISIQNCPNHTFLQF